MNSPEFGFGERVLVMSDQKRYTGGQMVGRVVMVMGGPDPEGDYLVAGPGIIGGRWVSSDDLCPDLDRLPVLGCDTETPDGGRGEAPLVGADLRADEAGVRVMRAWLLALVLVTQIALIAVLITLLAVAA
ncbi:hypothetical protein GYA93_17895 [Gordonia desulfuricans]|uniref:Uncharacterized protein n=1 Tax=Gordonia desulfuricans TaxID=89051 RepID=A0A7K3LTK9_9ACTN|nr:hypothetical protein [Gordonia desulfuricans]NDK91436.1 hypothetical protein [Gordonia desulfuricans]